MKTVSARQANHDFSNLLSRVERCEEILITKRNKPVAMLSPYRPPLLPFWDAMLWASAQRAGVRCLLAEDLQDGFILQSVRFVNPFKRVNDRLINEVLPPVTARR